MPIVAALCAAALPVVVVNPRQVRDAFCPPLGYRAGNRPVEGAVDLDGIEVLSNVFELIDALLRRIDRAAQSS